MLRWRLAINLIIFDLDGTLVDSKLDLAHSVNATREHYGLPLLDNELVSSYVGNGAPVLIRRALGPDYSEEEIQQALEFFLATTASTCWTTRRSTPTVRSRWTG